VKTSKRDLINVATNPDPERERKVADETLALQLLADYPSHIEPDSAEEVIARAALARCVRDGMRGFAGELLALAIDPDTPPAIPGAKPIRRVRFETPGRRASTWARDMVIGQFIAAERAASRSGKLDAAVKAACDKYGLGRSTVQAIWGRREELLGRRESGK
jgi:hypothetical protein